nr:DUF1732 domain-containing protein [Veillonella denticariosi]
MEQGFYTTTKEVPLSAVMSVSNEWIQQQDEPVAEDVMISVVTEATSRAVAQLLQMRSEEGHHIQEDLLSRISTLKSAIQRIDENKSVAVENYRNHIISKIKDYLIELEASISEDRFLQEIAILADKTDITEEIVRFTSHVVQLKNTLIDENPIERKLDFILQEMNREVNTIGSKTVDSNVTKWVVHLKCELEKIREQVQNVE